LVSLRPGSESVNAESNKPYHNQSQEADSNEANGGGRVAHLRRNQAEQNHKARQLGDGAYPIIVSFSPPSHHVFEEVRKR